MGKSSVAANLAVALAALGHTVGVLDADIWGFSVPRMLGVNARLGGEATGRSTPMRSRCPSVRPRRTARHPRGDLMGFLVEDEGMALMWRGLVLAKAVEQFLTDVRWGEPGLTTCSSTCLRGRATSRWRCPASCPGPSCWSSPTQALLGRRGKSLGMSGGRHGPALLPEGGRRGGEHQSLHLQPRAVGPPVRVGWRGDPGRPKSGRRSWPDPHGAGVAAGGDPDRRWRWPTRGARPGRRSICWPTGW